MSKELEALKRIRKNLTKHYLVENAYEWSAVEDDLDTIETVLKDYEQRIKLAKEYKDVNNVGKRLKALEIMKDNLNVDEILFSAKGVCNSKDYDLLKEVLS